MNTKKVHAKAGLYAMYFEMLKHIAEHYGYALMVHGSMNRDLDLVAIPWVETSHKGALKGMLFEMQEYLTGKKTTDKDGNPIIYNDKPHGRMTHTISLNRGDRGGEWVRFKDAEYYIDISIMPIKEKKKMPFLRKILKGLKDEKITMSKALEMIND